MGMGALSSAESCWRKEEQTQAETLQIRPIRSHLKAVDGELLVEGSDSVTSSLEGRGALLEGGDLDGRVIQCEATGFGQ